MPGVPPGAGAAHNVVALWDTLLAQPEVEAVGLGARDSLRLEARASHPNPSPKPSPQP